MQHTLHYFRQPHRSWVSRLRFVAAAVLTGSVLGGCSPEEASTEVAQSGELPTNSVRAAQLAQRYLIVDTHIDVPYRVYKAYVDVSQTTADGDFDFPRAKAGGLDALFMSIYVPADVDEAGNAKAFADGLIDSVEDLAAHAPEKFAIATCSADVHAIKSSGRIALPMGMENGGPIGGSFDNLEYFADRGIRYITLTHSKSNHISDSSYDDNEHWQGLSEFGKTLIPQMNLQGVMIDISHVSDRAFWQVVELTQAPIIASHSSLRHFTPGFQRNMTDEMVTALGKNGGVIQINFGSSFLSATTRAYATAAQQAVATFKDAQHLADDDPRLLEFIENYRVENPYPFAAVTNVLDHIDRVVELTGINHVGLGSDYDGVGDSLPNGLKDVSEYPNLVAGLLQRGYRDEDIEKILGGNIMRVWAEVEAYASATGNPPQCRQISGA